MVLAANKMGTDLSGKVNANLAIILKDGLGYAHLAKCNGAPPTTANMFQHGCLMMQIDSGTGVNSVYQNIGSTTVPNWALLDTAAGGGATSLVDTNGFGAVTVGTTASAVNGLIVTDSATTTPVTIAPYGSDASIGLTITPKAAAGVLTLGLPTGTGNILLGSSSGVQSVLIANGTGAATVNIANVSTAGNTVTVAGDATATGNTDAINLARGNAVGTGVKSVNILTGVPATSGNNKFILGGGSTTSATFNATLSSYSAINYITTETGANNAIAGALVDSGGNNITLAAGLRVLIKLAHTLQVGANTFNLNGGGAVNIKSHLNVANNIGTAYTATGTIDLFYDGTEWVDMSQ